MRDKKKFLREFLAGPSINTTWSSERGVRNTTSHRFHLSPHKLFPTDPTNTHKMQFSAKLLAVLVVDVAAVQVNPAPGSMLA